MLCCIGYLKLVFEALFIYLFSSINNKFQFKFCVLNFLKLLSFVLAYSCLANYCGYFVGSVIYKFVFVMFVLIWRSIQEKNFEWKCILGFSFLISVFVEFGYLLSYRTIEFIDRIFKTLDVDLPAVVTQSVVICLYIAVLMLIYKSKLINIKDMKVLSSKKCILVFFAICLGVVVCLRELLRTTSRYTELYDVLWCIVLAVIPTYVVSYIILSKIARLKNMDYNYNIDGVIENGLEVPKCCAMFNIDPCSRTYESEKIAFRKKLNSLNIDHGFKGYSQLILCLVMIRCFENKNTMNLKQDIFKCVSDFTKTNVGALYASFAKIVSSVWLHETTESLQYGYITDDENIKSHIPTVEEFVLHIAETTYC